MKSKSIETKQNNFYFILEKLVNVALAKTKKNDNQSVIDILNNLRDVFDKLWGLKQKDSQKFNELFWDYDFFGNYVQPRNNTSELKKDAYYTLVFNPERNLKGITVFIQAYEKIWQCALNYNNDTISRYSVYHLVWMLDKVVREESNSLIIEQFLRVINSISFQATNYKELNNDSSIYTASIYWYFDIVFNRFSPKSKSFDLSYLDIFNKYFFESLKNIVSSNKDPLFNEFVSHLHEGIPISSDHENNIRKYIELGYKFEIQNFSEYNKSHKLTTKGKELVYLLDNLDKKDNLDFYLTKLNEIDILLNSIFTEGQKEIAIEIKDKIIELAIFQLKFNNILNITFEISSYCIFKQKLEYIKYLWEYKQPFDADASHCGYNILPNTIKELFNIYFRQRERNYKFENHHGSSFYHTQYLLILLTYLHVHHKKDLEMKIPDFSSIIILETEYLFINKFLLYSTKHIEIFEILIKESYKWDCLLSVEEKYVDEYQPEYNNHLIKVTAKKQFDNTEIWLKSKIIELNKTSKEIEKHLPIDSEKELKYKKALLGEYIEDNRISKIALIKETVNEDLDFDIVSCCRYKIEKRYFIRVSEYNCDMLFSSYGKKLVEKEMINFVKKIVSHEDIEQIDIGSSENLINTYDAIESSINSLLSNGLTPSTIIMPSSVLSKFLEERKDCRYKFYKKFTAINLKFNEFINLEIVNIPQEIENDTIITLDKTSCILSFRSIGQENERAFIEINENKTDPKQVDLTVKTTANLEIIKKEAIKILKMCNK